MTRLMSTLTSGRVVLAVFIVTQAVYLAMVLVTLPHLKELAGGLDPFDMRPGGYSLDEAMSFIGAIGAEGRNYYLTRQIPLDLAYPGLFAVSWAIIWLWLHDKAGGLSQNFKIIAAVPALAGLSDYAENGFIVAMLNDFPNLSESLVTTASAMTIAKSVGSTIYFVALIGLLVTLGIRKFKGRKGNLT